MARCSAFRRWGDRFWLHLLLLAAPVFATVAQGAPGTMVAAIDSDAATAAYLLNFARFTEWPATARPTTANAPYVIGVSGSRSLLDALIRLVDNQYVHNQRVHVVRIKDLDSLAACQLVYLSPTLDDDSMGVAIPAALAALRGKPVLTVAPAADFIAMGGLVQLFQEDSRLRFSIAAESARKAGLIINSRLLALARPVPTQP